MQQVLRLWLLSTVVFLTCAFIWVFMPVLVPFILLTVVMGGGVAAIVSGARLLERTLRGPPN